MNAHVLRLRLIATLAAALALISALALGGASPAAAASTPVQVIFSGSGTYTIDQTYVGPGGSCTSHDVATLTWSASFQTTIDNGELQSATGELAAGIGPGNLAFTIAGTCIYKNIVPPCNTQLTFSSSTPPSLTAGGSKVEAQSIVGGLTAAPCEPTDAGFIGSDVSVLQASLPGSLTAVADMQSRSLAPGSSTSVSSSSAPSSVSSSCIAVGAHGTGNTSCSASLSWSGTISITCGKGTETGVTKPSTSGPRPVCSKEKHDAAKAAKHAGQEAKDFETVYVVNCSGTNKLQQIMLGVGNALTGFKKMCWESHSQWHVDAQEAKHYKEIAKDPPDRSYGAIASPHPPKLKGLQGLRRDFPANYKLMRSELRVAGLVGAVTTSLNRASTALSAVSEGEQAAASDVTKQEQAARSYAKHAAQLLASEHRLATKARDEWRRFASSLHGGLKARVAAAVFRRFAATLASKQSAAVTKREIVALKALAR